MRGIVGMICCLCFFYPVTSAAQVEVPCLEKNSGRWKLSKQVSCVQMDIATFQKYTQALLKLKFYQTDYEPKSEKIKIQYQELDARWKQSFESWQKQEALYQKMGLEYKTMAQSWEKAFFKLKDQKTPSVSWTQSNVLWLSVGVVVTAGAIGLGIGLSSLLAKK